MPETGKTKENPHGKGLPFLIHPKITDCLFDFWTYSNRTIRMEGNLQGKDSVANIYAYTPTSSAEDEKNGTIL